jgi:3D (Asp-Asp-Asp) domain-containing protein/septal ring factor EnvC (AmiA/AmiB activator)
VRGDSITRSTRALAVAACSTLAIAVALPASHADTSSSLRSQAQQLSRENGAIANHSRAAVLTLYALDTRLARAEAELSTLRAQAAAVEQKRTEARRELGIARRLFGAAQRNLANRLRTAYEHSDSDPLAIVLGAKSIDDALSGLETVNAAAASDKRIVARALRAKASYLRLRRRLAARAAKLEALEVGAAATARSLAAAKAERIGYLRDLENQRRLNAAEIGTLESRAQSIEARSRQLAVEQTASVALSTSTPTPAATTGSGQSLTVVATAYTLTGTTATGAPVGYGVVAVDPSVIPLGTRMSIPGYGEGVAADTGGAIHGDVIDLWFPSADQAAAWGRRMVTISLH